MPLQKIIDSLRKSAREVERNMGITNKPENSY